MKPFPEIFVVFCLLGTSFAIKSCAIQTLCRGCVESGCLFVSVTSGQDLCISPRKLFFAIKATHTAQDYRGCNRFDRRKAKTTIKLSTEKEQVLDLPTNLHEEASTTNKPFTIYGLNSYILTESQTPVKPTLKVNFQPKSRPTPDENNNQTHVLHDVLSSIHRTATTPLIFTNHSLSVRKEASTTNKPFTIYGLNSYIRTESQTPAKPTLQVNFQPKSRPTPDENNNQAHVIHDVSSSIHRTTTTPLIFTNHSLSVSTTTISSTSVHPSTTFLVSPISDLTNGTSENEILTQSSISTFIYRVTNVPITFSTRSSYTHTTTKSSTTVRPSSTSTGTPVSLTSTITRESDENKMLRSMCETARLIVRFAAWIDGSIYQQFNEKFNPMYDDPKQCSIVKRHRLRTAVQNKSRKFIKTQNARIAHLRDRIMRSLCRSRDLVKAFIIVSAKSDQQLENYVLHNPMAYSMDTCHILRHNVHIRYMY